MRRRNANWRSYRYPRDFPSSGYTYQNGSSSPPTPPSPGRGLVAESGYLLFLCLGAHVSLLVVRLCVCRRRLGFMSVTRLRSSNGAKEHTFCQKIPRMNKVNLG